MLKYHMGDHGNHFEHTNRRQSSIIGNLRVLASEQFLKDQRMEIP